MTPAAHTRTLRDALLAPATIALVGASDDPAKASSRPLRFLRASGYAGAIYTVNARRDSVAGERSYRSVRDLPVVPEHVFVMSPTETVVDVISDCAEVGATVATVLSGGFADAGEQGRRRQLQLLSVARAGGVRLLGPNSIGVVDLTNGLRLTGNAVFAEPDLPAGGLCVASQSGSMIGALVSRGKAKGLGFAGVISVGGEADLSVGEVCAATLDDDGVTGYLLFLETIRHAGALASFAREAAARGKPVVAYKLGRSPIAAELAVSHTGALVGDDDVASTLLADCGIARVDSLDGLLEAPALLRKLPIRPTGSRPAAVGVVTTTGGGAAMVVDQLAIRGVQVVQPSADTHRRLSEAGVSVSPGAVVDLTLAGTRYDVMKSSLDVLLAAPEFDAIIAVAGSSARSQPELAVAPILDSAGADRVLATFVVPDAPAATAQLSMAGVPTFTSPETCGDVFAAALSRRWPIASSAVASAAPYPDGVVLNEAEGYRLLERAGVPVAPYTTLDVDALLATDAGPDTALPFRYPVAVKALHAELTHKSDVGAVVLGVSDAAGLRAAARSIRDQLAVHRPDLALNRLLVQPMARGVGEALVSYRLDRQVGPLVVVAAGGTLTELYRDRSVRLAPVDFATAATMVDEVIGLRALAGYRGQPAADLDALAEAIVTLSRLAHADGVLEAELNPVVLAAAGGGVRAVDALVTVWFRRTS